jgi:dihydropteroate synthase
MQRKKFPKIMGIVNVTPDSFSDGGLFAETKTAIDHALKLIDDGVDILDIGGESSRPNADEISIEEECKRVIPVIEGIRKVNSIVEISIDTVKYTVAKAALGAGANIINDISGLSKDIRLASLAYEYNAGLIIMHIQGSPRTMQINPSYTNVVEEVFAELSDKIAVAHSLSAKNVMADIGIGFGKTAEHNWTLLKNLKKFENLGVPLVLGISRKSFLGKLLGIEKPIERDTATVLLHALLLGENVEIIRVHDVQQMAMLRKLWNELKTY